jgi:hypothetical protein
LKWMGVKKGAASLLSQQVAKRRVVGTTGDGKALTTRLAPSKAEE